MESKKNTLQIVLICILAVLVLILAAALYRSWRVAGELRVQLAEAQNNTMTVENEQGTQVAAAEDNTRTVRVMNGILQQQDENGEWLDVAPVEELQQADPILIGKNKMQELIAQNREAVQNGTANAEEISSFASKQSVLAGATLAAATQVQSAAEKTTQSVKPAKPVPDAAATIAAATHAPTQQPAAVNNSSNDNHDDGGGSDSGSSDSGSSDSGSSDSGSSDSGSSDDSSDSGDGEDVGWTDEVL